MLVRQDAILLRIVVDQYHYHDGKPLAECLLLRARDLMLQSGIVVQGRMGFISPETGSAPMLRGRAWDSPVIIEFVDSPEKIKSLITVCEDLLLSARMSTQEVTSFHREASGAH